MIRNDLDAPTGCRDARAFADLARELALAGMDLVKTDPDAPDLPPFYVMRWGWARPLESLDEARQFLRKRVRRNGPRLQAHEG